MDKIVCTVEPGLGFQTVNYYEKDKLIKTDKKEIESLAKFLIAECYANNCYNLHLIGSFPYLTGIIEEISIEENTNYNTHKILLEVN